jgi:signal transduction histidine kinase
LSLPVEPAGRREGLYHELFDQSYQATWVLSADGVVLSANRRARAIMMRNDGGVGLEAVEVAFPTALPSSRAALAMAVEAAQDGETSRLLIEDLDPRHGPRVHEVSLRGAGGDPGEPLFLLLEAHDVTERRRVEESLRAARLAAESADRAKSAFLARMSHEMRTPLHAVLGFARLLLDAESAPATREALLQIEVSGRRLLNLVDDVLELASIEAGGLPVADAPADLGLLLRQLGEVHGAAARDKGLELTLETDPDLPAWLRLDEPKLRRALGDLLDNAVKFTERGGVILRVLWQPRGRAQRLGFEIVDSGPGIDRDQIERLLSPFEVDRRRQAGTGTGLGLALARRLVLLLGGEFQMEGNPGRGTRIILELPTLPVGGVESAAVGDLELATSPPAGDSTGLERLAALPSELREELRAAAQRADWRRLEDAVGRVAAVDAEAGAAAAAAADRYDYAALLRALPAD